MAPGMSDKHPSHHSPFPGLEQHKSWMLFQLQETKILPSSGRALNPPQSCSRNSLSWSLRQSLAPAPLSPPGSLC